MKRRTALLISIFLTAIICLPVLSEDSVVQTEVNEEVQSFGTEYLLICSNGQNNLYLDTKTGAFILSDLNDAMVWYSNPEDRANDIFAKGNAKTNLSSQLLVEFVDTSDKNKITSNSFIGSIQLGGAKFAKIENGFAAIYTFPEQNVTIPIEVTLKNGYINVCVKYDNIVEKGTILVTSITVLPYFGAGSTAENGYLLVPDGSGALIDFNNGRQSAGNYKEEIYGLDAAVYRKSMQKFTQKATMPVFGIQSSGQGLFAIIDSGAPNMTINGEVSMRRTSYNTAFSSFDVRLPIVSTIGAQQVSDYPENKIDIGDINIRYYPYSGDGGYSRMAQIYKEYLIKDKGMKPAESLSKIYVEILNSYTRKTSFLGFPYTKTEELTTFNETKQIVEKLLSQSIDGLSIILRNYSKSTVDGELTKAGGYLRSLGGKSSFDRLKAYLEDNDVELFLMTDLIRYSKSGKVFSRSGDAVRNVNNSPSKTYNYSLSTYVADKSKAFYYLHPAKLLTNIQKLQKSLIGSTIKNIGISDLATTVYADSGKVSPVSKTQTVEEYQKALSLLTDGDIGLLAGTANGYVFPYVSHIVAAPAQASLFGMENESIPFYQMAISGLISCSVPAINHSSMTKKMFLRAIETGSALYFILADNDGKMLEDPYYQQFYSIDSDYWTEIALSEYKEINVIFSHTGNRVIVNHCKLDENVYRTTYENGTSVIVNYNRTAYESENGTVSAMGYLLAESED